MIVLYLLHRLQLLVIGLSVRPSKANSQHYQTVSYCVLILLSWIPGLALGTCSRQTGALLFRYRVNGPASGHWGCIMRRQCLLRCLKASRELAAVQQPSCRWTILEDSPPKMHAVFPGLEPGIPVALHHVQRVCPQNNVLISAFLPFF